MMQDLSKLYIAYTNTDCWLMCKHYNSAKNSYSVVVVCKVPFPDLIDYGLELHYP